MYQHFSYLWQFIQHFILYLMRDLMSLANTEIAAYHDVQVDIETESHFPHEALI